MSAVEELERLGALLADSSFGDETTRLLTGRGKVILALDGLHRDTSRTHAPKALDEFISHLDQLRMACGQPSLRALVRASQVLVDDPRYKDLALPTLSSTALSDVLNRRRIRPPRFQWVASFVLACQRFAADSGLRPDPGFSTLHEWNQRLNAIYRQGRLRARPTSKRPDVDTLNARIRA